MSCAVKDCKNIRRLTPVEADLSFHQFPRNPVRCQQWLEAIGREKENWNCRNKFICSEHFRPEDIIKRARNSIVTVTAVPQLQLRGSGIFAPQTHKPEWSSEDSDLLTDTKGSGCEIFTIQPEECSFVHTDEASDDFNSLLLTVTEDNLVSADSDALVMKEEPTYSQNGGQNMTTMWQNYFLQKRMALPTLRVKHKVRNVTRSMPELSMSEPASTSAESLYVVPSTTTTATTQIVTAAAESSPLNAHHTVADTTSSDIEKKWQRLRIEHSYWVSPRIGTKNINLKQKYLRQTQKLYKARLQIKKLKKRVIFLKGLLEDVKKNQVVSSNTQAQLEKIHDDIPAALRNGR